MFETEFIKHNDMLALCRGPFVYSLEIEEDWQKREYIKDGVERKYPYCDYEIYPKSKWNYGFADLKTELIEKDLGEIPFSKTDPCITILADMAQIAWDYKEGYNFVCSEKPIDNKPLSKPVKKKFKPYGCSTLRMTEMPMTKGETNEK